MFAHNTEEVIESDEYGKAVFHAVDDNMDEEDFTGEAIQANWFFSFSFRFISEPNTNMLQK